MSLQRDALGDKHDTRSDGFTLIEMMAVVMILALVSTLVMVNVMDRLEWAKVEVTKTKMRGLEGALEMFQIEKRSYPATQPGLEALLADSSPNGRSFVRDAEALDDAWARPFEYESPGQHRPRTYDLWSWGSDGQPGGEGHDAEITNWLPARTGS